MQLQEKQETSEETSEEWRSGGPASDRQTVEDKPLYVPATAATVRSDTSVLDRSGMVKAVAIIIAIRFFAQFILGPAQSYLLAILMRQTRVVLWWFTAMAFVVSIGIIVGIGQIVARLAPRKIIPTIAYGNAIGFLFNLVQLAFLYFVPQQGIHAMLPMLFFQGLLWTVTNAVTEIVVAQYFVRKHEKETTSAYSNSTYSKMSR